MMVKLSKKQYRRSQQLPYPTIIKVFRGKYYFGPYYTVRSLDNAERKLSKWYPGKLIKHIYLDKI